LLGGPDGVEEHAPRTSANNTTPAMRFPERIDCSFLAIAKIYTWKPSPSGEALSQQPGKCCRDGSQRQKRRDDDQPCHCLRLALVALGDQVTGDGGRRDQLQDENVAGDAVDPELPCGRNSGTGA